MTTPLSPPPGSESDSSTGVGFPSVGTGITIGLVNWKAYQQTDYNTGEPKTWPDGKPMMGTVITGIAYQCDGVETGPKGDKRPIEAGEQVTIWVEGGKYYPWRDALKGAVKSGHDWAIADLIWFGCIGEEPTKNPGWDPRKVYDAKIGKPGPDHAELVTACEAAHRAATAIPVDAPATDPIYGTPAPASAPF